MKYLFVTLLFATTAFADVCPFGECPKVTPPTCFESFAKPECAGTHIDWGNDLEEWQWISSEYPVQIQVAGNFIQSCENEAQQEWQRANQAEREAAAYKVKVKRLRARNKTIRRQQMIVKLYLPNIPGAFAGEAWRALTCSRLEFEAYVEGRLLTRRMR